MTENQKSAVFKETYDSYIAQVAETDFTFKKNILGIAVRDHEMHVSFFNQTYRVSKNGIINPAGQRPPFAECIILVKYLLLCPDRVPAGKTWTAFRDFKGAAPLIGYFAHDAEKPISDGFVGRPDELRRVCKQLGGLEAKGDYPYDSAVQFQALPRISMLLLFNDADSEFPAHCTLLFEKRADRFLDPESLSVMGAVLGRRIASAGRSSPLLIA